jgi:IS5 family transposase
LGNKVGLVTGGRKGKKIILSICGFMDNPYDVHTIEPLPNQMEDNKIALPKEPHTTVAAGGNQKSKGYKLSFPHRQKRAVRYTGNRKTQTVPCRGGYRTGNRTPQK